MRFPGGCFLRETLEEGKQTDRAAMNLAEKINSKLLQCERPANSRAGPRGFAAPLARDGTRQSQPRGASVKVRM